MRIEKLSVNIARFLANRYAAIKNKSFVKKSKHEKPDWKLNFSFDEQKKSVIFKRQGIFRTQTKSSLERKIF